MPAVVILHGAAGVLSSCGPLYARQLAGMGVAGVVVEMFGAPETSAPVSSSGC